MKLTTFLKKQFEDFVEVYRKYLLQTSGITLAFTLICFVGIALLLRFSDFDESVSKKQFSLLSYFFVRYSKGDVYSIVDLSKTVFIFFVSVFSLGLTRIQANNQENAELKISDFLKQIFLKDMIYFLGLLILCSAIDYGLYQIDFLSLSSLNNNGLSKYFHGLLFQCRIYIPLLLFAFITYRLSSNKKLNVDFKKIFFLAISLWLFNEFSYEFSVIIRNHLFALVLLLFSVEKQFFAESFLGIILIAFYFVGYHSAMSTSLKILDLEDKY